MGLTADERIRGLMLGVQRIKLLIEPVLGGHPGVHGAATPLRRLGVHGEGAAESRNPKNRGPDHRVPVIARAITERLRYVLSFHPNPSSSTTTRSARPFHSRTRTVPGRKRAGRWPSGLSLLAPSGRRARRSRNALVSR